MGKHRLLVASTYGTKKHMIHGEITIKTLTKLLHYGNGDAKAYIPLRRIPNSKEIFIKWIEKTIFPEKFIGENIEPSLKEESIKPIIDEILNQINTYPHIIENDNKILKQIKLHGLGSNEKEAVKKSNVEKWRTIEKVRQLLKKLDSTIEKSIISDINKMESLELPNEMDIVRENLAMNNTSLIVVKDKEGIYGEDIENLKQWMFELLMKYTTIKAIFTLEISGMNEERLISDIGSIIDKTNKPLYAIVLPMNIHHKLLIRINEYDIPEIVGVNLFTNSKKLDNGTTLVNVLSIPIIKYKSVRLSHKTLQFT